MARPVRLDYPNTFYHVLSRGNERRDIFWEQDDYARFSETVAKMVDRFGIEVHAYVFMSNHYHLLIRTRDANLSKAVQWLGLSYSVWFNRRHLRSGHLFQGRFKSFVVENDRYFAAMCLYIHGNPIRAGIAKSLLDYPWSSYPKYAGARATEPWLTTDLVLGRYGGSRKRFIDAQHSYLGKEKTILDKLRYGLFLGSEQFVKKWKIRLRTEKDREKPQARMALKEEGIEVVTQRVFTALGVEHPGALEKPRRGESRPDRDLAIYMLCHMGIFTHQAIGKHFGVGYTSISGALKRAQALIQSDQELRQRIVGILNDK